MGETTALLAEFPGSVVAWEANRRNAAQLVVALELSVARFQQAVAVIMTDHEMRPFDSSFREAGAIGIVPSLREVGSLASLAARHFARLPAARFDWRSELLAALPWRRHDSGALAGDTNNKFTN